MEVATYCGEMTPRVSNNYEFGDGRSHNAENQMSASKNQVLSITLMTSFVRAERIDQAKFFDFQLEECLLVRFLGNF